MYVPVFGFGKLWLEEVCGWAGAFSFRAVLGLLFLVRVGFFVSFSASPSGSASRSDLGSDFGFGFGGHTHISFTSVPLGRVFSSRALEGKDPRAFCN